MILLLSLVESNGRPIYIVHSCLGPQKSMFTLFFCSSMAAICFDDLFSFVETNRSFWYPPLSLIVCLALWFVINSLSTCRFHQRKSFSGDEWMSLRFQFKRLNNHLCAKNWITCALVSKTLCICPLIDRTQSMSVKIQMQKSGSNERHLNRAKNI